MRPGCNLNKCRANCRDLTNDVRQQIFDTFYGEGANEDSQVRIDDKNYNYIILVILLNNYSYCQTC